MRVALYKPDIPGNVGAIIRLTSCFGVPLDIIMPCGFAFSDKALKRSAMDYGGEGDITRHANEDAFFDFVRAEGLRVVLMTTQGATPLPDMRFTDRDVLLMGSESAGAPDHIHDRCDARVKIPLREGYRSLNISVATGIALGEALRQTNAYPK